MKKATSQEFLSSLTDFKSTHAITDSNFDYYATIKFCQSTFLNDYYNLSIVKTDSAKHPILLQYHNKNFVVKLDDSIFFELHKGEINNSVPVLRKEDHLNAEKMLAILKGSHSFKSFVENFKQEYSQNIDSSDTDRISYRLLAFNIANTLENLETTLKEARPKENTVKHHFEQLKEQLASEILLGSDFSVYQMSQKFRSFVVVTDEGYSGPYETSYDKLMDSYYTSLDQYFDLFKFQQVLKTGLLLNAKTEEELLNTPVLNEFIDSLKSSYPEWFKSFDDSLVHSVIDDNGIRAMGVSLLEATADFDLLSSKSFVISAYPTYTDGYTHISGRFMQSETNSVHIYGDNIFFKPYYHNLTIIDKADLKICTYIQSDIAFAIPDEKKIDYLLPVLDYFEKNQIVLDLDDSNCSFLYHIRKDELHKLVQEQYPNLILLNGDIDMKKSIEIHHSKNFKEAFKIYKQDDTPTPKKTKSKNAL
jgi:hypothetical protein